MTPDDLADILKKKLKDCKKLEGYEYPEYYDGYNALVRDYEDIRYHSVKGVFPERLFAHRSPNQTDEEYKFVKNNYQQTANLPMFMDTVSSITRIFNSGNWSIKYQSDEANKEMNDGYREYVESEIPTYFSVENFMVHVNPANKLRDAMGVVVVKPKITYKQSVDSLIEDDQVLRQPELFYFPVKNIISSPNDKLFVIQTNEKVKLTGNQEQYIYWIIDENYFYIMKPVGKLHEYKFEMVDYIEHKSGETPVRREMGVPAIDSHGYLIYQSPFLFAVPALNVVILDQSYLQISKDKTAFPVQIMLGNECEFIDNNVPCIDGWIGEKGTEGYHICPKCKGSGMRNRLSPQGTLLLRGPSKFNEQGEKPSDALTYVSPDTSSMELLRTEIKENLSIARSILHLKNDSVSATGENTVESEGRRESFTAFITPIGEQMFSMYEWILKMIGMQRYGEEYPKPQLIYSNNVEYYSDEDYLNLIQKAQAAGAPSFVMQSLIWKYLSTIFYTDLDAARITDLIMSTDRLVTLNANDITQGLLNGTIEPWEKILHDSATVITLQAINEDENFWSDTTTDQQRRDAIIAIAKNIASTIQANKPAGGSGVPGFQF